MEWAGIDGCRAGWVGLRLGGEPTRWQWSVFPDFASVLAEWGACEAIAVDMPIGLLSALRAEPRPCDRLARQRLGRRAACVFIPPTRPMLQASDYAPLRALGLSVQAYHLIPRIRELDSLLTPDCQAQVWESHPELGFTALVGTPIAHPKRTPEGQRVRLEALQGVFGEAGVWMWEQALALRAQVGHQSVGLDDLLDAWVLAWSAGRHLRGEAETLIGDPARDERGLQMFIRY